MTTLPPVMGRIKTIEEWAVHDGPGLRCIVFLKGCALRCVWCQNPELIYPKPEIWYRKNLCDGGESCGGHACVDVSPPGAITLDEDNRYVVGFDPEKGKQCFKCVEVCKRGCFEKVGADVTSEQVLNMLMKFKVFYDQSGGGVTLSGGEPLFQPEFSEDILRRCQEAKIDTTIESCLYAKYETVHKVVSRCSELLCDVKHMNSEKHKEKTGVPNELILENLTRLNQEFSNDIYVRVALIPGFNDDEENIRKTVEFLNPLEKVKGLDLLPFNDLPIGKYNALSKEWVCKDLKRQSDEHLQKIQHIVDSYSRFKTTIGGLW